MFTERLNPKTEVKVLETALPHVVIMQHALDKMWTYVQECADEVGWMGSIEQRGNIFILKDVYLFRQEVHSTTTEINAEGLNEFGMEILAQPDGMDLWNSVKLWGHSHVNMSISPSGQDNDQMQTFAGIGHDYFFRLIANKKKDLKIDMFNYAMATIYLDVPWEVVVSIEEEEVQQQIMQLEQQLLAMKESRITTIKEPIVAEMKDKVKKKSYYQYSNTNRTWIPPVYQGQVLVSPGHWEDKITPMKNITSHNNGSGVDDVLGFPRIVIEAIGDLTDEDIVNIAFCNSIQEVSEELRLANYQPSHFSYKDKQQIWDYCLEKAHEAQQRSGRGL